MGLPESALKGFSFYHIVRYRVIVHAVLKHVEKITIAMLISIHMNMLTAIAKKSK